MSLTEPNVKWAVSISKVKDTIPTLEKALAVAQEVIPRPVLFIVRLIPYAMKNWYENGIEPKARISRPEIYRNVSIQ